MIRWDRWWLAVRRPRLVATRLRYEVRRRSEQWRAPRRQDTFDQAALLRKTAAQSLEALWHRLAARPYLAPLRPVDPTRLERLCPGAAAQITEAATRALERRVALLGSAETELGRPIDWHQDFKVGRRWPAGYGPALRLVHPEDSSDVKVPWELSRLHWLLPLAQAARLGRSELAGEAGGEPATGEVLAAGARDVLDEWIAANPCASGVCWGVAMEAALRLISWSYLFHVFAGTEAWADPAFRSRFLRALYLHADFVERHFEESSVNGNHFTADAAGLVFAGLFFGEGRSPRRWLEVGWRRLVEDLPRQVPPDGVDFEVSTAYHRLVLELFLLAALYRHACGLEVPSAYRERLEAMAGFVASYTRQDGLAPLWGDADDGRALPLGGQDLNDHRYLVGLVAEAFDVEDLRRAFSGPLDEVVWLLGEEAAERLSEESGGSGPAASSSSLLCSRPYPHGGVFIMRNARDHVFIDCGPVGLGGHGGHGHNDCLSFEACLSLTPLVSDCGSFVYTADLAERDRFRSSRSHNAPVVDGEESNRLDLGPWLLRDDARPELRRFEAGAERDVFVGAHSGYRRLARPVTPVRALLLDHRSHGLIVRDGFEGCGRHRLEVPLHLAPGVEAHPSQPGRLELVAGGRRFLVGWEPAGAWELELGEGRVSPRYGVALPCVRLAWRREGPLDPPLVVWLVPEAEAAADPVGWANETLAQARLT